MNTPSVCASASPAKPSTRDSTGITRDRTVMTTTDDRTAARGGVRGLRWRIELLRDRWVLRPEPRPGFQEAEPVLCGFSLSTSFPGFFPRGGTRALVDLD